MRTCWWSGELLPEVAVPSGLKSRRWRLRPARLLAAPAVFALAASLAACSWVDRAARPEPEQFGSTTTHSRNYAAGGRATCEAARRALLSQGYVVTLADGDHVNGRKNFQPQPESHVEVEFHVVCAPDDRQGRKSIVFVNALQDRYALKKSNNSASLGVGILGSVSLPFSSSDDALVKVASETITTELFYERFFALVDRYLVADSTDDILVPAPSSPAPNAAAAAALSAAASASAAAAAASAPAAQASAP